MAAKTEKTAAVMKLLGELNLSGEHINSMQTIDNYFEKHRINELFNEVMTNVL